MISASDFGSERSRIDHEDVLSTSRTNSTPTSPEDEQSDSFTTNVPRDHRIFLYPCHRVFRCPDHQDSGRPQRRLHPKILGTVNHDFIQPIEFVIHEEYCISNPRALKGWSFLLISMEDPRVNSSSLTLPSHNNLIFQF
jgi:hypothetical protein